MHPERWAQVNGLLELALEQPAGQRDAYLRSACAGDVMLEQEVQALLALEPAAQALLETPPAVPEDLLLEIEGLAGRRFSHYRIIEEAGAGGMGVVYKAEDTRLHRHVALKLLSDERAAEPAAVSRFRREAQAASALNHPNICTVYDIGEQDGRAFIVMEYLEGSTLKALLAQRGALDRDTVLTLATQITDALDAAHAAGIVHRDIKPANIFVGPGGNATILDFGLAKLETGGVSGDSSTNPGQTEVGTRIGTPAYMAPEQTRGEGVDARADIWALGIVLCEMATGARPQVGVQVRIERMPQLKAVIARCLAPDPDHRYQTARQLQAALASVTSGSRAPGRTRPTWTIRLAVGALAAGLAIAGTSAAYVYGTRPPVTLTSADTIVIADFENRTGERVFDGTLRHGLTVQLAQSPFLSPVSEERIRKTLRLMGRPDDAPLSWDLAREVCERTSSAAVVQGTIARLGASYVVDLRARLCSTGAALDDEQEQAARQEDVLAALSTVAARFRAKAGESLETVQQHNVPLEEATTPSLEALKAFSVGWTQLVAQGHGAALSSFKRATAIDPDFATAHAWLGRSYASLGEAELARASTRRAWDLRTRASGEERFYIDFSYYRLVTGELEKAAQTCREWALTYPRDVRPRGLLSGSTSMELGRYDEAQQAAEAAIAVDPEHSFAYMNLAASLLFRNRPAEALSALQRAVDRHVDLSEFEVLRYQIAFLQHDAAAMQRAGAAATADVDTSDWMYDQQAEAAAYAGHLREARLLSRRAADGARRAGRDEAAAQHEAASAVREALFGNAGEATRAAAAARALSNGRDVLYGAAVALTLAGDAAGARAIADDLEARFPQDTSVRVAVLPTLRALDALRRQKPGDAIVLLQSASPYDVAWRAGNTVGFAGSLYAPYVRGEALRMAGRGDDASLEYQKVIDHKGIVGPDPMGAIVQLQLARALVLAGRIDRARTTYQDFLTLWRDADPDVPVLLTAKAEYARLLPTAAPDAPPQRRTQ